MDDLLFIRSIVYSNLLSKLPYSETDTHPVLIFLLCCYSRAIESHSHVVSYLYLSSDKWVELLNFFWKKYDQNNFTYLLTFINLRSTKFSRAKSIFWSKNQSKNIQHTAHFQICIFVLSFRLPLFSNIHSINHKLSVNFKSFSYLWKLSQQRVCL